jgi:hypothetical protein
MADLKLVPMLLRKLFYLLLQQDIILRFIRINDPQLRLIPFLPQNPRYQCISRRDPRPSKDQRHFRESFLYAFDYKLPISVVSNLPFSVVSNLPCRASDLNLFSNGHAVQDISHGTTRLSFIWEIRLHN